jgi:hypothetical protein
MTKAMARWVGTIGLAAVLVAGCADRGDDDAHSADDSGANELSEAPGPMSTEAGGEAGGGADADAGADAGSGTSAEAAPTAPTAALDLVATDRDVVRTGSMWVTVDEVDDAAADVRARATDAGGFVADEQLRAADDRVDVTVRVPADAFEDVRAAIGHLGDVTEQDVQAQDVTAEMVDVESRIASLRASVERVRALLGQAGDVAQLALVEGELASRETELEALLGQQRVLADQVALATLTVHLGEDEVPSPSEDAAGFTDGFRRGWVALVDGGQALLAAVGFLLPFAVPAGLVALALRWWVRRRPSATPPTPATEPRP